MSHDVFWPGTAIPKTHHNGFTMGLGGDWSDIIEQSKARARSAALVERRRPNFGGGA